MTAPVKNRLTWLRLALSLVLGLLPSASLYANEAGGYVCSAGVPIVHDRGMRGVAFGSPSSIILASGFVGMGSARQWVVSHECAHALGHGNEDEADCKATEIEVCAGRFSPAVMGRLRAVFNGYRGTSRHSTGPQRLANIQRCAERANAQCGQTRTAAAGLSMPVMSALR